MRFKHIVKILEEYIQVWPTHFHSKYFLFIFLNIFDSSFNSWNLLSFFCFFILSFSFSNFSLCHLSFCQIKVLFHIWLSLNFSLNSSQLNRWTLRNLSLTDIHCFVSQKYILWHFFLSSSMECLICKGWKCDDYFQNYSHKHPLPWHHLSFFPFFVKVSDIKEWVRERERILLVILLVLLLFLLSSLYKYIYPLLLWKRSKGPVMVS